MNVIRTLLMFLLILVLLPSSPTLAEDGPMLASLTLSPSPDWHVPFDPQNLDNLASGQYESSPEVITVIVVTQDPGATFTINGQPGVNGEPMTLTWDKWAPGFDIEVLITDPDGSKGYYGIHLIALVVSERLEKEREESPALQSLTISPTLERLGPGPVGPEWREYQGGFPDGITPEVITVVAITEDPGATFTINEQPGANGEPMTLPWDKWTPWLLLDVAITDPDGSSGHYFIYLTKMVEPPFVSTARRGVKGVRFAADATVTMTVLSAPGGVMLVEATPPSRAGDGQFFWDFADLGIPVILQPGMEVRLTDGVMTATHVVLPFTIDDVNLDTDTIRGTGAPGAKLHVTVFPTIVLPNGNKDENPEIIQLGGLRISSGGVESYDPAFIVDASGHWGFDLGAKGIDISSASEIFVESTLWPQSEWGDPDFRASFNPLVRGDRGNTGGSWPTYDEIDVNVILDLNAVGIEHLPSADIKVDLTVRSSAGGSVLFTDSQLSDAEGNAIWGTPQSPDLGVVLEPGMEVTATWGETSRSAVLDEVRAKVVDHESDHVSGVGPADERILVIVGIGDPISGGFTLAATAQVLSGPDGSWQADFNEDITVGMMALALSVAHNGFVMGAASIAVVEPTVIEENSSTAEASDETEIVVDSVARDGSEARVAVPAGALPSGSSVRVAAITNTTDLVEQAAIPEGTDVALGFSISAEAADGSEVSAGFSAPVAVEFTVEASALPASFDPDSLSIAFWNGARWAALQDVQAVSNPDGSVTLRALADHFTLFAVVNDAADAIRPGPADPLDEAPWPSLGSLGLDPGSMRPDEEGGLTSLPVWIGGGVAAAILLAAGWIVLRRRGQSIQS